MTNQEFLKRINDRFMYERMDDGLIRKAEYYASILAREHWPEVHCISVTRDGEDSLKINIDFVNEEAYVWWTLKNE